MADFVCGQILAREKQMKNNSLHTAESLIYPFLLVLVCWTIWLFSHFVDENLVTWGIMPHTLSGLRGIAFMPFIHDPSSVKHVLNNTFPMFVFFAALIYYYRSIALKVSLLSWFLTGTLVWFFAKQNGAYHIGMSGLIYALFGFLFLSGMIRRIKSLQGLSLVVIFVYGSLVWGIFPTEPSISWEGHLSGFLVGITLAYIFRKEGPQPQKYQYEIEKELGIEPPDLEGEWLRKQEEQRLIDEQLKQELHPIQVIYHIKPKSEITPSSHENEQNQNLG